MEIEGGRGDGRESRRERDGKGRGDRIEKKIYIHTYIICRVKLHINDVIKQD